MARLKRRFRSLVHLALDVDLADRPAVADEQPAVHLGVLHVDPVAAHPHLGREVGGAVEALGQDAVGGRRREAGLGDGVEGGGQPGPDACHPAGVPVGGDDHRRPVGPQVAVGRAQAGGVGPPGVDGGQAVQVQLGGRGPIALGRRPPGLEVDQLHATVALVGGVDAPPHQVAAHDQYERRLHPHGVQRELGVRREARRPARVHLSGSGTNAFSSKTSTSPVSADRMRAWSK